MPPVHMMPWTCNDRERPRELLVASHFPVVTGGHEALAVSLKKFTALQPFHVKVLEGDFGRSDFGMIESLQKLWDQIGTDWIFRAVNWAGLGILAVALPGGGAINPLSGELKV